MSSKLSDAGGVEILKKPPEREDVLPSGGAGSATAILRRGGCAKCSLVRLAQTSGSRYNKIAIRISVIARHG